MNSMVGNALRATLKKARQHEEEETEAESISEINQALKAQKEHEKE